jgi:hypothetical protein
MAQMAVKAISTVNTALRLIRCRGCSFFTKCFQRTLLKAYSKTEAYRKYMVD